MAAATKSSLLTVFVVIAASFVAGGLYFEPSFQALTPVAEVSAGMRLKSPRGYSWHSSARTLVLGLHVGCPHCENEMGFYEHLVDLDRTHEINAHLLAVFPDSENDIRAAFSQRLIGLRMLPDVPRRELHITVTPTVMLVDDHGLVMKVWLGELSPTEKQEVLSAVQLGQ